MRGWIIRHGRPDLGLFDQHAHRLVQELGRGLVPSHHQLPDNAEYLGKLESSRLTIWRVGIVEVCVGQFRQDVITGIRQAVLVLLKPILLCLHLQSRSLYSGLV
jgi:hypothetical protein